MTTQQAEWIEGKVTATNDNGFQIDGKRTWYNYSQYADDDAIEEPAKGDRVRFAVAVSKNGKSYVQECRVVDGQRPVKDADPRQAPAESAPYVDRDMTIARESAVKSAIEMLSHHQGWLDAKVADKLQLVLQVARRFEAHFMGAGLVEQARSLADRLEAPVEEPAPIV